MSPDRLKEIFRNNVSQEFLVDAVALLEKAYPEAYTQEYRRYSPPEAHDMVGHARRAMIEESIREIAARYPGMKAIPHKNKRGTQSYSEVRSGQVVLTVSCLHYPQSPLRQAHFRSQYTCTLQHAIKQIREDTVVEGGAVFAVLAHGPQTVGRLKVNWAQLGFAFAGFPTINFRAWEAQIELMSAYGRQAAPQDADSEDIRPRFELKVRQGEDTGKSGTGA